MRQVRDPARYEREKRDAINGGPVRRMAMAMNPRTHQEILYYMAEHDPDPAVRQAVARNPSSPIQATTVQAADRDGDVRLMLAERLVRLLPTLSHEDHAQLYAIAVQALGTLAQDELLNIRVALASTLKDHAYAPPAVVSQLARDVERAVAEPILRFCAALPDDVLLDILKATPKSWAVQAIANRGRISEPVAIAVIDTGDVQAGCDVLRNPGAQIGPESLRAIVARARTLPEWQEPLALRKGLPPDAAMALAEFADASVRDILLKREDFDARTTDAVSEAFRRRLGHALATRDSQERRGETPYDRAVRMMRARKLDEQAVSDALAMREEEFVIAAIACLARVSLPDVRRVFGMRAPKPIVALCWKAGLSMRLALRMQQDMGRVPFRELLYPRDGTDYPLEVEDMRQQLDFLGLAA